MQPHTPRLAEQPAARIVQIEREDMGQGAAIVTLAGGGGVVERRVPAIQARQWPDTSAGHWYLVETAGAELMPVRADVFEALFQVKG